MCAVKYLLASTRASSKGADGACIPTFPALPSQKAKGFTRGTAIVGLGGVGFVAVAPCLAKDYMCLVASNATFSGQNIVDVASSETDAIGLSNLPYDAAAFQAAANANRVNGRIVGSELTVQYTGTVLNRSGMVYAYTDANHSDVVGMSVNGIGARQNARVVANRGQQVSTSICAVRPEEVDYTISNEDLPGNNRLRNQLYPFSTEINSGNATVGALVACIMFTGVPGETFQFEYHQHVEYNGGATAGRTTETELDTPGFQAVNTAVNASAQGEASDPYGVAAEYLNRHGYNIGRVAAGIGKMAMGAMAMPNAYQRLGA